MFLVPLEDVDGGDKVASHGQPDKMLRLYGFEIPFHRNDEKEATLQPSWLLFRFVQRVHPRGPSFADASSPQLSSLIVF